MTGPTGTTPKYKALSHSPWRAWMRCINRGTSFGPGRYEPTSSFHKTCSRCVQIGNSSVTGIVSAPMWSYSLGLQQGWMPQDPREAVGICGTLGVQFNQPVNSFPSWQTGGAGAGTISASVTDTIEQYPPTLSNAMNANPTLLPHYSALSANPTLPPETFTSATTTGGNGWADAQDTMLAPAPIAGCSYPDAWFAPNSATAFVCGGAVATSTPTS